MPFYSQTWLQSHPELRSSHLSLGSHPETGDELLIPERARTMGIHLIGKAGSGKSSEIKNLVHQDALKHNAVILFDPHDDLVDECIAELPQASIADTLVLDLRDESFPYGVSLFAEAGTFTTDEERTAAIERIVHIFNVLWPEIEKQQYARMMLRYAIVAFLDYPGATLPDMIDFFKKDDFRVAVLAKCKDRTVREYFADEYDRFSPDERTRRIAPLMNRLYILFVGRALPRNILGQRVSSVNFRKAIEEHQLIFIKLPTTTMGEDARLIGTILMSQLSAAIFSFVNLPPHERPTVAVYADEVSQVATPDFERLVVEGRKFGVKLCIAHQNQGQLDDYLVRAANGMHTQIMFRVTPEDAKSLALLFPMQRQAVSRDNIDPHASKYLLDYGADDPLVQTFIDVYLRPLQTQKSGRQVEIVSAQRISGWDMFLPGSIGADSKKPELNVPEPTPYLDALLYEVMRANNPLLPIPIEAIAGFANCGGGFYPALKWRADQDLRGDVMFPAHLANETASGYVWRHRPESDREWFMHCIFHLRMVMIYLAEHPLLKGGKVETFNFAQALIQLPVRMALVKSGDDIGQIVTSDTPRPLVGEALSARRYFILQHTRQRYCHPRDQVEELIDSTTPPDEFTLKRWKAVKSDDGTSSQSDERSNGPSGAGGQPGH